MTGPKQALLLAGSPKGASGNSHSLLTYLKGRLQALDVEVTELPVSPSLKSPEKTAAVVCAVNAADVVVLFFPLYIDCLPADVIKVLGLIADSRSKGTPSSSPLFLAISNSGFPESRHNAIALEICRSFARKAKMRWAGGLALGGGGSLGGHSLDTAGGRFRHARASLDLAAAALAHGNPVPQEAIDLMAKPVAPTWLYLLFGSIGWKRQARKYAAHKNLDARPYRQD